MRRASADLPLHTGTAPRWLFSRMVRLGREICRLIVEFHGPHFLLRRLADPFWFQALGCLLGFDWHSSGLTTTVCGALKTALAGTEPDLGIFVAGGKGSASRKTPEQVVSHAASASLPETLAEDLVRTSRLVAKIDSAAVQDGFQIYHHMLFFLRDGTWCVVQQGMDVGIRMARRYHWHSACAGDLLNDPHAAVCCDTRKQSVLNLVASESDGCRESILQLAHDPKSVLEALESCERLVLPRRHHITCSDFDLKRLLNHLSILRETSPRHFHQVLLTRNVGPKTLRALSLAAEIIFATPPSFRDPARFAFAHGGKDGTPFPVDRKTYDETIEILSQVTSKAKIAPSEKEDALARLRRLFS